jgi:hypothetical protein
VTTTWIHPNDTLQQMFLARMLILAAAIGMGIIVFGVGAIVVRCAAAARLRFGRRTESRRTARPAPHLSDSYAPALRHPSNSYPPNAILHPSHAVKNHGVGLVQRCEGD